MLLPCPGPHCRLLLGAAGPSEPEGHGCYLARRDGCFGKGCVHGLQNGTTGLFLADGAPVGSPSLTTANDLVAWRSVRGVRGQGRGLAAPAVDPLQVWISGLLRR